MDQGDDRRPRHLELESDRDVQHHRHEEDDERGASLLGDLLTPGGTGAVDRDVGHGRARGLGQHLGDRRPEALLLRLLEVLELVDQRSQGLDVVAAVLDRTLQRDELLGHGVLERTLEVRRTGLHPGEVIGEVALGRAGQVLEIGGDRLERLGGLLVGRGRGLRLDAEESLDVRPVGLGDLLDLDVLVAELGHRRGDVGHVGIAGRDLPDRSAGEVDAQVQATQAEGADAGEQQDAREGEPQLPAAHDVEVGLPW